MRFSCGKKLSGIWIKVCFWVSYDKWDFCSRFQRFNVRLLRYNNVLHKTLKYINSSRILMLSLCFVCAINYRFLFFSPDYGWETKRATSWKSHRRRKIILKNQFISNWFFLISLLGELMEKWMTMVWSRTLFRFTIYQLHVQ